VAEDLADEALHGVDGDGLLVVAVRRGSLLIFALSGGAAEAAQSGTRLTNPTPLNAPFPEGSMMPMLTPITRPEESIKGPPLLPGLMAQSEVLFWGFGGGLERREREESEGSGRAREKKKTGARGKGQAPSLTHPSERSL
jgi:hypothetical protein